MIVSEALPSPSITTVSNEFASLTSSLRNYLRESQVQLDAWVEEEKKRIDKEWDDYRTQYVEREQAQIDAHVANLLALQLERGCTMDEESKGNDDKDDAEAFASGMAKKVLELQEQAHILTAEIAILEEKQQQRLEQVQEVTNDKEQKRARAEAIAVEKMEKQAAKIARLETLTKIVLQYHDYLGFHYEKTENLSLRLWFTQMDANDPERMFSFLLSADDQDLYVVEGCQPHIEPEVLAEIMDQVNGTDRGPDDFSQLILSIRKAFAAMI